LENNKLLHCCLYDENDGCTTHHAPGMNRKIRIINLMFSFTRRAQDLQLLPLRYTARRSYTPVAYTRSAKLQTQRFLARLEQLVQTYGDVLVTKGKRHDTTFVMLTRVT
jgi:hypothetical protein